MASPYIQVCRIWKQAKEDISKRFDLESNSIPKQVIVVSEQNSERKGGYYNHKDEVFFITKPTLKGEIPLKGVIYRECLFSILPKEFCEEARRDLGYEYARQNLNMQAIKDWIDIWTEIPSIRIKPNLLYDSYKSINWHCSLGGDKQLDSIIHEFHSMAKYGLFLDFIDYVDYMNQRIWKISVKISQSDLRLITIILENQESTNSQIAQLAGLSKSWTSTQIKKLQEKFILNKYLITPFSRIGIKTYHLLLSGPVKSDPTNYLSKCPFLYSIQYVLNGPWQIWARLAVPDNSRNVRALKEATKILPDMGIAVDLSEVSSAGMSHSFYHYNSASKCWNIPWLALKGWGKRIEEENLHKIIRPIDVPTSRTNMYLDEVDIKILSLIRHGLVRSRAIRKEISIGQNRLSKRLQRLKLEGLLRKVWNIRNIGLIERVALRTSDKKYGSIIDAWSRDLPKVLIHHGGTHDLFVIIELPIGDSANLMNTLRELRWNVTALPLTKGVWGQWEFPYHLWEVESQSWKAHVDKIENWLDSLHTKPKTPHPDFPRNSSEHVLTRV